MCFRENNIGRNRQAYKLEYGFHDVNSILYTAYPCCDFTESFPYWKLSLTPVNQNSFHPEKYKKQTLKQNKT